MKLNNSIVMLQPGMYILRHPKGGLPPISVGRAPGGLGSVGRVEVISTPRTHGTILRDGSDCIVMHVMDAPVELLVTAYLAHEGAVVPALKVDQIGLDDVAPPAVKSPAQKARPDNAFEVAAAGVSLVGHVERTGDVLAGPAQCLGDPAGNLRLEGFQLVWPDRPQGVDVAYNASAESYGPLPRVTTGNFCGTRGEGRRLTEVTFALVGPNAEKHQLEGVAYFSGGFQMPVANGLALNGPSGLEHLTALRLQVVAAKPQDGKVNPWKPSARTKVLKSSKVVSNKK